LKESSVNSSIESFPIQIRAQLLKDLFKRLQSILEIHCTGYLLIFYDGIDDIYIKIRKTIEEILNTEGFSALLDNYPKSIPLSLHAMGQDADIEWEFLNQEIIEFTGLIIEFCIDHNAGYEDAEEIFKGALESHDEFINGYRRKIKQDCQKWFSNIEKKMKNVKQDDQEKKEYINPQRINNLKEIQSDEFDLTKLIHICEEINHCNSNKCYFAVALLLRSLIDHIPPIFNFHSFHEIANNYNGGGKSFKESMEYLDMSLRKIADSYLHVQIRKQEILPNNTQIDFSNNVDVLLGEICRVLKKQNQ